MLQPEASWRAAYFRLHPELRRALKAGAAMKDLTMEEYLHQILCRELGRDDLVEVVRPEATD